MQFDKDHIKTLYNLGSAYLFLGNISEGKNYFEKVLKLDQSNIPSFRNYVTVTKIDKNNKLFKHYTKNTSKLSI